MQIYLDNSATTRQYNEVTSFMMKTMNDDYGNPSSLHRMGLSAEHIVKEARRRVAGSLGVSPEEIFFTGGGTESDNIAIRGTVQALKRKGKSIITSKIEHPAVLETCKILERQGFDVFYADVNNNGLIDIEQIKEHLTEDTILITVMHVNNELGTIQPITELGRLKHGREKLYLHTDAVQSFGKLKFEQTLANVEMLSLSGHKIHGPKGVGAIYIKKGTYIEPSTTGGGQEHNIRPGTENVPGIAGLGLATEMIYSDIDKKIEKNYAVRKYLLEGLKNEIKDVRINSYEDERCVCSILNVSFLGTRAEVLLHMLEENQIYVSTGSACSSNKKGKSHVLKAAGLTDKEIDSAIRFSFSEFNTVEEMDYVLSCLKKSVADMRKILKK